MSILVVLIASVVSLVGFFVMLLHPVGPAMVLLVITPFDAIPFDLFGVWGNAITYVPVLILLLLVSPQRWPQLFLGSRIQVLCAVMLIVLLVSHALAVDVLGYGVFEAYARKATLVVLAGFFAHAFIQPKYVLLLAKVLVVSMTAYLIASMSDFYLGIQLLPSSTGEFEEGALQVEYERYLGGKLRFSGAGIPVNRTANWQILPIFLAVGVYVQSTKWRDKALMVGGILVMLVAVMATVSRSTMLALVIGAPILASMALRVKIHQLVLAMMLVGVVGGSVYAGAKYMEVDQNLEGRLEAGAMLGAMTGRFSRVIVAFEIWAQNPVLGVGIGSFKKESDIMLAKVGDDGGRGAHNAYTEILAETGLLGFIPFMAVLFVVTRQFLVSVKPDYPDVDFWRPYFFAAFVGQLGANWFNSYIWERLFWVCIAYAIVLERYSAMVVQDRRRKRIEALQSEPIQVQSRELAPDRT